MNNWVVYLHENGDLISKTHVDAGTYSDMQDSSFVRAFWIVDPKRRDEAWNILVEANMMGANKIRVDELAKKWGCNDDDAKMYAAFLGLILEKDGSTCTWCAHKKDFVNTQESPCGFGGTALDAFSNLAKAAGFRYSKTAFARRWFH